MIVRSLPSDDLTTVFSLLQTSFDDELSRYLIYAQSGIANYLESHVRYPDLTKDKVSLVAVDYDRVLGYAEFRYINASAAVLSYICVDGATRGRGVATALIDQFRARTAGSLQIELDVFVRNAAAISLYRKLGFEACGQSEWYTRPIAPDEAKGGEMPSVTNLAAALAAHQRHGFCELFAQWQGQEVRLGMMGEQVLRCFSPVTFGDGYLASVTVPGDGHGLSGWTGCANVCA